MASKTHEILGELYRLVGAYSDDELIQASRYAGLSRYLRNALRLLASEQGGQLPRRVVGSSRSEALVRRQPERASTADSGSLLDLIRQSKHYESPRSLVGFAREFGIKLQAQPKESRERLARRLARSINAMPVADRVRIVRELQKSFSSAQTEGWLNVIKASNP